MGKASGYLSERVAVEFLRALRCKLWVSAAAFRVALKGGGLHL